MKWLERYLLLERVMMDGWNHSRGSRLEHEHACTRGIPVAYSVEEAVGIVAWLGEGVA